MCSPRERGWTQCGVCLVNNYFVFPARAGMDLTWGKRQRCRTRVPRASGDGPPPERLH